MRKVLLLTQLTLLSIAMMAQPKIKITSPSNATEPYKMCLGTTIELSADTTGVSDYGMFMWNDGWSTCTEMPDFDGFSNSSKWQSTWITDYTYSLTFDQEIYLWYTTNVSGGMIGSQPLYSNVIHIQLNGTIPTISYSDSVFCEGSSLNLTANPSDLGDGKYQWYKDGLAVEGEINANFLIVTPGSYSVSALSNETDCPDVYYSSSAIKFSFIKPVIAGIFKADLNRVVLSTTLAFPEYQWQQATSTISDLTIIENAIESTYNATITNNDKYYAVKITTADGCVSTSDRVIINDSIYSVPAILTPEKTFLCRTENVTLNLTNKAYASYQWFKDGVAIYNAKSSSFNVTANYPGGTGKYTVKVSTPLAPNTLIESNAINLTFAAQPNISIKDNAKACPGEKITLQAATGYGKPVGGYDTYQWYFNDVNNINSAVTLNNATDSLVEINVPTEKRYYWVKTDVNGCADQSFSYGVQEFTLSAPYISKNPYDGLICLGDSVTLQIYGSDISAQWYFNDKEIAGATDLKYKTCKTGYYDVKISSTICKNTPSIVSIDSAIINYRYQPSFSVDPYKMYNNDPKHTIGCSGDTMTLSIDDAYLYKNYQWLGKLWPLSSNLDDFEPIEGQTDSVFVFENGKVAKLHLKAKADYILENDKVCTTLSDYLTIDQYVFSDPAVSSDLFPELCQEETDSTMLRSAFPGTWVRYEWYLDGELVPNSNKDTIWAKQAGMWVIVAYPELCPTIPHSSGIGPTVKVMPEAEIWENDSLIWAVPFAFGEYTFEWYFNDEPVDPSILYMPHVILKDDMHTGNYTVKIINRNGCIRESEPYTYVGIEEDYLSGALIYPNPFNNEMVVEVTDYQNVRSIEVYNISGSRIDVIEDIEKMNHFSTSSYQSGIYIVKVNFNKKEALVKQLVKQ